MKLFLTSLLSFSLYAYVPVNFKLPESIKGEATFVDFKDARYELTYDVAKKKATYKATINFEQKNEGKPVFDVVIKPTNIKLNGEFVAEVEVATPQNETKLRIIDKTLTPGNYKLEIEGSIINLVKFVDTTVSAAHWTSDLSDRSYLENYLPTNLEYDQYQMTFEVEVLGTTTAHKIYANGDIEASADGLSFTVTYPSYFTCSSSFFHIAPVGKFKEVNFEIPSVNGKNIPVLIYGDSFTDFDRYTETVKKVIKELEADYGSFPHKKIVILNGGSGGMEYCGATMTEHRAVQHELTHSYFARGIIPANGNSGWLDEAIASWRDNAYPRNTTMSGQSGMSSHNYYTRKTDTDAYSFGARFISYLDGKVAEKTGDKTGFKSFLKYARENYLFTPFTVENFVGWMESFYSIEFMSDFKKHTYTDRLNGEEDEDAPLSFLANPMHQKLSIKELESYL